MSCDRVGRVNSAINDLQAAFRIDMLKPATRKHHQEKRNSKAHPACLQRGDEIGEVMRDVKVVACRNVVLGRKQADDQQSGKREQCHFSPFESRRGSCWLIGDR